MGAKANSGEHGYRISKAKYGYVTKVPCFKGMKQRTIKSLSKAKQWQLRELVLEWGALRLNLLKKGRLSILRKFGCGVSVRKTISKTILASGDISEYVQFGVYWYENNGNPKSRLFSYKRFKDNAELEAHWFAAQQRAILTNSELNLPHGITIHSFDLDAAVKIKL